MCPSQQFTSFTTDQFDCLLAKASAAGISISGNSGSSTKDGVTVEWNFEPAVQTLSIQCTSAPFFIPCSLINGKIQDLIASCQGVPSSL